MAKKTAVEGANLPTHSGPADQQAVAHYGKMAEDAKLSKEAEKAEDE